MKSRWTTYLLLAAVVSVWGVVAWRIFTPRSAAPLPLPPKPSATVAPAPEADILRLDYPDPFLKRVAAPVVSAASPVHALPASKPIPARRERVKILHAGTISVAGRPLYILTIGDRQYELTLGEEAEDFQLTTCDGDSVYLCKAGVTYGVALCQ